MAERVWYVGYGSNVNEDRLRRYLTEEETEGRYASGIESRWIELRHRLYFAGNSKTWDGSVAFCALSPSPDSRVFPARAYALSEADLVLVLGQENGRSLHGWDLKEVRVDVGDWTPLPVALALDGFAGKYNALLRLPDIEGEPTYTVTTSHRLPLGRPAPAYLDTIIAGLDRCAAQADAVELVRQAAAQDAADNQEFIGPAVLKTLTWSGAVVVGRTVGIPAVRLPTAASGTFDEPSLRLGTVRMANGPEIPLWVSYALDPEEQPTITPDLAEVLGLSADQPTLLRISSSLPIRPRRLAGYAGDIPPPDVVHVDAQLGELLGPWALIHTQHISGPARVIVRSHVPAQSIRIAYGVRTIFGLSGQKVQISPMHRGLSSVQPRRSAGVRRLGTMLRTSGRRVAEAVLGAPVVALRATEGLVGDDGRAVVRVDSTALDYLGLNAGDQAILNWATRSTPVRVLLQTEKPESEWTNSSARPPACSPALR